MSVWYKQIQWNERLMCLRSIRDNVSGVCGRKACILILTVLTAQPEEQGWVLSERSLLHQQGLALRVGLLLSQLQADFGSQVQFNLKAARWT